MAQDATQVGLIVGTAALINSVHAVNTGRDASPRLAASGVMFAGLVLFGALTNRYDFAVAIAWVFLIASLFTRGIPLIRSSVALTKSPAAKPGTPQNPIPVPKTR